MTNIPGKAASYRFSNTGGELAEMIVRFVPKGGQYGLKNRLVHTGDAPLVEFYDPRYPHNDLEVGLQGQFISRYSLPTLEGHVGGIDLEGGVPAWTLTEEGLKNAMAAISHDIAHHHAGGQMKDESRLQTWIVEVSALRDFEDLDPNDVDETGDCIVDGTYRIVTPSSDPEAVLDIFHDLVPIKCLDDFDILARRATEHDTPETLREDLGEFPDGQSSPVSEMEP